MARDQLVQRCGEGAPPLGRYAQRARHKPVQRELAVEGAVTVTTVRRLDDGHIGGVTAIVRGVTWRSKQRAPARQRPQPLRSECGRSVPQASR
eukprot:CAMPEP_0119064198 /NCGR_PEP_ID=MMETSP1178-20130426/7351_1 /TAXON_ID=33656 /ORGANISM="unid sp, Strain CCMP2000" /LENGTH=92 /DNA_ID=CAMNT_0007045623 /DNA_START=78 /DNA_END=356 /DNA_ORIENTATION=-